jgi:hypothetical protein
MVVIVSVGGNGSCSGSSNGGGGNGGSCGGDKNSSGGNIKSLVLI